MYSALLPELAASANIFDFLFPFEDPLLSKIVMTLAQEIAGGFADKIMVESLGTALCIRIARRFVGRLPLPIGNKGLAPERLRRVCDYIEAHIDDDLSLTVLADIACLSPYHFSRSFKEAVGIGTQRYVVQRRIERAKTLMRRTNRQLALIALHRPEPSDIPLPSRDRGDAGPISRRTGLNRPESRRRAVAPQGFHIKPQSSAINPREGRP